MPERHRSMASHALRGKATCTTATMGVALCFVLLERFLGTDSVTFFTYLGAYSLGSRAFRADVTSGVANLKQSRLRTKLAASRRDVLSAVGSSLVATAEDFKLKPEEKEQVGLFERNSPGVVYITNEAFNLVQRGQQLAVDLQPKGTGTGWVFDTEGHIVTNYHVIKDANALQVRFIDGFEVQASVVGADPMSDVAVLQVSRPAKKLQPLRRGCSGDLKIGQDVFAIGSPFGLDQTLTKGIISGLGRTVPSQADGRPIQGAIQTDASINPGNSGGPLLNTDGNLIGMNTEIVSPSGASAGVGFAIPSDTITARVASILKYGYVKRPSLGLYLSQDGVAKLFGLEGGSVIAGVQKISAAGSAGVQAGDVITKIGDKRVKGANDIYAILDEYQPGDIVTVEVSRNESKDRETLNFKTLKFEVKLLEAGQA